MSSRTGRAAVPSCTVHLVSLLTSPTPGDTCLMEFNNEHPFLLPLYLAVGFGLTFLYVALSPTRRVNIRRCQPQCFFCCPPCHGTARRLSALARLISMSRFVFHLLWQSCLCRVMLLGAILLFLQPFSTVTKFPAPTSFCDK